MKLNISGHNDGQPVIKETDLFEHVSKSSAIPATINRPSDIQESVYAGSINKLLLLNVDLSADFVFVKTEHTRLDF